MHLQDPLSPVQLLPALGGTLLRRRGVMMVMVTEDVIMVRYPAINGMQHHHQRKSRRHCKRVVVTLTRVSSLSSDVFS
jgi:hypothetical protein